MTFGSEAGRREFIGGCVALVVSAAIPAGGAERGGKKMFGLIGSMTAATGRRDELIGLLLDGTGAMPGCLSYIVAKDLTNPDVIWVTEVWDSKTSHEASLGLPAVKNAIAKGRPIITGFGAQTVTEPVGGHGLKK